MQLSDNSESDFEVNNINIVKPDIEVESTKRKNALIVPLGVAVGLLIVLIALFFTARGDSSLFKPTTISNMLDNKPEVAQVMNPLTGELVLEEEATWTDIRPMAAMVNNAVPARPQSGLIYADLVYEIVAEGGITRFMPFFLSNTPEKIGPIRSTREYYLVLVKELGDAMLMHIGWSPQALTAIETWPVRSLGRGGAQFWRDQNRINNGIAIEHTAYVNGKELRELGDSLGWEGTHEIEAYEFKDDGLTEEDQSNTLLESKVGLMQPITIDFWFEGDYSAIWSYDEATNTYVRSMGYDSNGDPIPHRDQETGEQIRVKNVIVQFAKESGIEGDAKGRLEYELTGSGTGLVFIDGTAHDVTWTKISRDERTLFFNENGEEFKFNRGKFWISIVPDRNIDQVNY